MVDTKYSKNSDPSDIKKPDKCFGVRHIQYALLFTIMIISFGGRSGFNVAVIAMTSDSPPNEGVPTYPEWLNEKNVMLSSFLWGYICLQIGAGQIAKNYGPKFFLAGAIVLTSVFIALIPIVGAHFGYIGVIICRILQGMTQGFLFPSCHNMISLWTPLSERTTIGSVIYAGSPLGNFIGMPVAGAISASSLGWPAAFYLYGALGVSWTVVWLIFGSDSPSKSKSISISERMYIEAELGTDDKESVATPWLSIFTSLPFWAILISNCGQNWGYWTLLTETPSYLKNILGFEIESNSFISAMPHLAQCLCTFPMSALANYLIVNKKLSVGATRKVFNFIGHLLPGISLFTLNFLEGAKNEIIISILVLSGGFSAGALCGFSINHIDIAPTHAGTLIAITNSMSNVVSLMAPLAVDAIKAISGYQETDKFLWNVVFSLASIIYVLTGVFYVFAASGEVQKWDNPSVASQNKQEFEKVTRL